VPAGDTVTTGLLRCDTTGLAGLSCDGEQVTLDAGAAETDEAYAGNWLHIFASDGSIRLHRIRAYDGSTRTAWLEPAEGNGASSGAGMPGPGSLSSYIVLALPARPEGVRLAVDGELIVDAWLHFLPMVVGSATAARKLAVGEPVELALEYRSLAGAGSPIGGGGRAVLEWSSPIATGGVFLPVPSERLYFAPSTLAFPLTLF
jgi:hypothetical protein